MGLYSFSCIGGIIIYTKRDIKKYLGIFYDIENLAYKGNQDAICIYIDIKSALNSLPLNYKHCVKVRFMYRNKSASITEANKGLKLMEDFLNGR